MPQIPAMTDKSGRICGFGNRDLAKFGLIPNKKASAPVGAEANLIMVSRWEAVLASGRFRRPLFGSEAAKNVIIAFRPAAAVVNSYFPASCSFKTGACAGTIEVSIEIPFAGAVETSGGRRSRDTPE